MMFKTHCRVPLTAAALAVLMAACGGSDDGGSNRVVASSPSVSSNAPTDSSGTLTAGGTTLNINASANAGAVAGSSSTSTNPPAQNSGTGAPATPSAPSTPSTGTTPGTQPPAGGSTGTGTGGENSGGTASTPSAPTTTPSTVDPTQPAAPISATGVRGDVLLTMLDQKSCLKPQPATAHDGTALAADQNLPPLKVDAELNPSNYLPTPGAPSAQSRYAALNDITCDPKLYPYVAAKAGDYGIKAISGPTASFMYGLGMGTAYTGRPFTQAILTAPLSLTDGQATVGTTAKLETTSLKLEEQSLDLSGSQPFQFAPTAQVSYGVLQQWTNGANYSKLMLLPGSTADEARLCWHTDSTLVKRLQCTVWRAPADWKRGAPLDVVDQYVVDDRTVHAGETGFLYWRAKFPG